MRETVERNGKSMTLIDLSDKLKNSTSEFEPSPHIIKYSSHKQAVRTTKKFLGIGKEYWPEGEGWAVEDVKLSTHSGTHIDAPYHYGSTMKSGEPARTIDEVPLSWCYGDGVVLSMTHKQAGEAITIDDLQAELTRIEYKLKPFDIVLIRTDASKYFENKGYEFQHPGLIRSSTEWLVNHGVKMIGIDAWGLDRPFNVLGKEALEGKTQFWEAHLLGREKEYLQIEKLTNLDQLSKPYGFKVSAFPVNIEKASAGWARVVAILED
jgi:kynurenine formamidase